MPAGSGSGQLLLLALPILLLLWMVFTQRKRAKQIESFQSSIQVGDEVLTTSGIYGVVRHIDGGSVQLEIASGVIIKVDRRAVGMRASDVTPARPAPDTPPAASAPDAEED